MKKKKLLYLSSRDGRVGAPCLHHIHQGRQVESERFRGVPRGVDRGRARHGLPREDPQPRAVDVQERLRPVAARAARAVGRGGRGSPGDDGPGVRRRGVSRRGDDPVGSADSREDGLELVEPLEERGQHSKL